MKTKTKQQRMQQAALFLTLHQDTMQATIEVKINATGYNESEDAGVILKAVADRLRQDFAEIFDGHDLSDPSRN